RTKPDRPASLVPAAERPEEAAEIIPFGATKRPHRSGLLSGTSGHHGTPASPMRVCNRASKLSEVTGEPSGLFYTAWRWTGMTRARRPVNRPWESQGSPGFTNFFYLPTDTWTIS